METMEKLDLENKNIIKIEPNTFVNLKSLKVLRLNGNRIESIKQAFNGLDNLETLYLEDNNLTKLEAHTFQNLNKLKELEE